jgi:hypothetical protein
MKNSMVFVAGNQFLYAFISFPKIFQFFFCQVVRLDSTFQANQHDMVSNTGAW